MTSSADVQTEFKHFEDTFQAYTTPGFLKYYCWCNCCKRCCSKKSETNFSLPSFVSSLLKDSSLPLEIGKIKFMCDQISKPEGAMALEEIDEALPYAIFLSWLIPFLDIANSDTGENASLSKHAYKLIAVGKGLEVFKGFAILSVIALELYGLYGLFSEGAFLPSANFTNSTVPVNNSDSGY
jgi:hypothetical protein